MLVMRAEFGPLHTDRLRASVRRLHLVPSVIFPGFHPDEIEVRHGDGVALLQSWLAQGCFMYSPLHPMPRVLLDVARIACDMIGAGQADGVTEAQVPDHLATYPRQPVYPEIAEAAGVAPIEGFWTAEERVAQRPARRLSLEEFIAGSFEAFANVAGAHLMTTPGVAAGLAALRLTPRW